MSRWLERVDDLLYDGEEVATRVDVGEGGVVVTSHRVLAFTPEGDGSNFDDVDRPNVNGVDRTTKGEPLVLAPAAKALVIGLVLLVSGWVIELDGLVGDVDLHSTGELGLGGLLATMETLLNVLALLDEILLVLGALVLLVGVALLGVYAMTREDLLVIEVAGDDDVELAVPDAVDDEDLADELKRAVRPGSTETSDGPPDDGGVAGEGSRPR